MSIAENYQKIRKEIPEYVSIVLAAKTRTREEIVQVINAGATDIGENYVQEAEQVYSMLGDAAQRVRWHMIGSLQKNKINKALSIFDVFQTVDSIEMAYAIDKRAKAAGRKKVSVYIEVNIGSEITKAGVKPEYNLIEKLAKEISQLEYIRLEGLMTMGPRVGDPEKIRPYFKKTKDIFDKLKSLCLPNVNMKTLSMGMSNSYKIFFKEATMLRTDLKHLETDEETQSVLKENENVMICCGRMGPMCIPVYGIMEELEQQYPHVAFRDMDFDIEAAFFIRDLPECSGFMGLPFTVYFKNGKVVAATTSIQSKKQITRILDKEFGKIS